MMSTMAKIVILMLGLITLARGKSVSVTAAGCSMFNLPFCTREYDPVCGSDGVEYSNECMLCLHNLEAKENVFINHKGMC